MSVAEYVSMSTNRHMSLLDWLSRIDACMCTSDPQYVVVKVSSTNRQLNHEDNEAVSSVC